MFRSTASNVSTLSSGVAKGHQTVLTFPSPPLKFRTAGFPQYGFKLAFNGDLRRARHSLNSLPVCAVTRHVLYAAKVSGSTLSFYFRRRTCVQAELIALSLTVQSRGPWLDSGLCCPAASMLTMASSESLASSLSLMSSRQRLCTPVESVPGARASPLYSAHLCHRAAFRTPVNHTPALGCCFSVCTSLRLLRRGSAFTCATPSVLAWPCNEAAKFA